MYYEITNLKNIRSRFIVIIVISSVRIIFISVTIYQFKIILCSFLKCPIITLPLAFAKGTALDITFFAAASLRTAGFCAVQQPQNVTISKFSGAIGVAGSRNIGSKHLFVVSLIQPYCSTSNGQVVLGIIFLQILH